MHEIGRESEKRWKRNEKPRELQRRKSDSDVCVGVMSFFSLFFLSLSLSLLGNWNAMNVNVNETIGNLRLQIALWARMTRINNSEKLYMIGQIFFCISSALKWLCRYNEDRLYQEIELERFKWTQQKQPRKTPPNSSSSGSERRELAFEEKRAPISMGINKSILSIKIFAKQTKRWHAKLNRSELCVVIASRIKPSSRCFFLSFIQFAQHILRFYIYIFTHKS